MRKLSPLAAVLLVVALSAAHDRPARACMLLGRTAVKVAGEEVLIVWDAPHHTEYFIRHLSFHDATEDFGFVVPTPSRPTLSDVSDGVFEGLFDAYKALLHGRSRDGLQVVAEQRVAGLDATVLAATDATALQAWLTAHHYPSTPAMGRYLAPYVANGSFLTAFRYTPRANEPRLGTRALSMSFTTDRPFFPYAEPDDAPHVAHRVFRISVISTERVTGSVGNAPWTARTRYAGHPWGGVDAFLRDVVPATAIPPHAWLTTFQEDESVRGSADLFFDREASQAEVSSRLRTRIE